MPVTSVLWVLSFLFIFLLCLRWIHSNKYQKLHDLFKIIKNQHFFCQPAIPLLGVRLDIPTYHSQCGAIWSNYCCSINSNLLYRTTDWPVQPVVIKSVFLHLFIITMECIYMAFIKSQRNILTILCVPVKCDFRITKVNLRCVFNLLLHFEGHSLLKSGAGRSVRNHKSLYYSISTNWKQLRAVKQPITNTFWLLWNLSIITGKFNANMATIHAEVIQYVPYLHYKCKI